MTAGSVVIALISNGVPFSCVNQNWIHFPLNGLELISAINRRRLNWAGRGILLTAAVIIQEVSCLKQFINHTTVVYLETLMASLCCYAKINKYKSFH